MVAVVLLNVPLAPEAGAVNVTFTPLTGLLNESRRVTAGALANAVLMAADCGVVPELAVIVVGAPALFVREKLAGVNAATVAVTLYGPPATVFALSVGAAFPEAFVATVIVAVELLNTALAPAPGAVNTTFAPLTGLLNESRTMTASGFVNAVFTVAD
jgi:hypothetical protein